jgi:hypothetical protein
MLTYQGHTGRGRQLDRVVPRRCGDGGADRHGSTAGSARPRPLGLHGKICPHLFIRDRHRPAPDHPLEDLRGVVWRSGQSKAAMRQFPSGLHTRTQRMTTGGYLGVDHRAVCENIQNWFRSPP